jgi:hypothetical protein
VAVPVTSCQVVNRSAIPEGAGPVKSLLLFLIFLFAVLRLLLGAPG